MKEKREVGTDSIWLKKRGYFYDGYDCDATLLNYLFSYKLVNTKTGFRVSFPQTKLEKIKEYLNNYKINYVIFEDLKCVSRKNFIDNKYNYFYSKCESNKLLNQKLIINIVHKLSTLSFKQLLEVTKFLASK